MPAMDEQWTGRDHVLVTPAADPSAALPHHHHHHHHSLASLPTWHFPGPSSRFHGRQRERSRHVRHNSSYTPTAPVLSTERRAHRRSHTTTHTGPISSLPSPPSSDHHLRSPLSRFASYSNANKQTSHAFMSAQNVSLPTTPAKNTRRPSSLQHSSPFSDYCTDDARSTDSYIPASEAKQLLVRMNKLQSHLMRYQQPPANHEATDLVAGKLSEIELALHSLHAQTRLSAEVEDSGVSMKREEMGMKRAKTDGASLYEPYRGSGHVEAALEPVTMEQFRAERDWFILQMQELLTGLDTAQRELTKRFAEVRELNERHNAQLEERETQLEQLRSENEGLRSDSGFQYSELLFLKLEMKSLELEVKVDALDEDCVPPDTASREKREKKNRILSGMDRWKADWQVVNGRFQRRRSRYGASPVRHDSVSQDGDDDDADWHLETITEGRGRVTSLTISRMDSSHSSTPVDEDRLADSALGASMIGPAGTNPLHASISDLTDTPGAGVQPFSQHKAPKAPKRQDASFTSDSHHGHTEPQITPPSFVYMEQGTQTESAYRGRLDPPASQDEAGNGDEDDCAITTSSEYSDEEDDSHGRSDVEDDEGNASDGPTTPTATKTAWQELWDSLSALSGMGDGPFED